MENVLRRVDEMCAAQGITRADVLCALVRAFIEGQPAPASAIVPALVPEQRAPEAESRARAEAAIRKVMRSRHRWTVRELKAATNSKRISVGEWDKALAALCKAGVVRVADEPGARGQTRRVVTLLDGAAL